MNKHQSDEFERSSGALTNARNQSTVFPEGANAQSIQKKLKRRVSYEGMSFLRQDEYKPAVYERGISYRDEMSYKKKLEDGSFVNG